MEIDLTEFGVLGLAYLAYNKWTALRKYGDSLGRIVGFPEKSGHNTLVRAISVKETRLVDVGVSFDTEDDG
jgi:hypothetical protein